MAGWQEELAVLLRELGVTQEELSTTFRSPSPRDVELLAQEDSVNSFISSVPWQEHLADAAAWATWRHMEDEDTDDIDDAEAWLDEDLTLMRREVEAIVRQINSLMQHGDFDALLKEDGIIVLRALRQSVSLAQRTQNDVAYLEAATSLLHFCRLILHLSENTAK